MISLVAVPSQAGAQITFALSAPGDVEVRILNIAGRAIRAIPPRPGVKGMNTVVWNGQSDAGTAAPAGPYLVELAARAPDGGQARGIARLYLQR